MQPWERLAAKIGGLLLAYTVLALGLARHLGRIGDAQLWTDT